MLRYLSAEWTYKYVANLQSGPRQLRLFVGTFSRSERSGFHFFKKHASRRPRLLERDVLMAHVLDKAIICRRRDFRNAAEQGAPPESAPAVQLN